MDPTNIIEAREFIVQARSALKNGNKESARDLGEKAALLAPDLEDAWLVLTYQAKRAGKNRVVVAEEDAGPVAAARG